jgi:hypothetical protein
VLLNSAVVGSEVELRCFATDWMVGRQHGASRRLNSCRRSLLAVLWLLHAGCCGRVTGGEGCESEVANLRADLAAERAKIAQLEAQLKEARDRSALLQAQVDTTIRPAGATDYAEPARRSNSSASRTGLASCPVAPIANESLPRGSYMNSCRECYRFGDSLRCSCFTRSQASHRCPHTAIMLYT